MFLSDNSMRLKKKENKKWYGVDYEIYFNIRLYTIRTIFHKVQKREDLNKEKEDFIIK